MHNGFILLNCDLGAEEIHSGRIKTNAEHQ